MKSTVNEVRYIPSFCDSHREDSETKCEVFYNKEAFGDKFHVIAYSGKKRKADCFYRFSSEEKRNEYIENYFNNMKEEALRKKSRKAERKEANSNVTVKVDDIFISSGGYEQTNISFYQVVEVKGKTAKLREIYSNVIDKGYCTGIAYPKKDDFKNSEIFVRRIKAGYNGKPSFANMDWGHAYPADAIKGHYCSWGY